MIAHHTRLEDAPRTRDPKRVDGEYQYELNPGLAAEMGLVPLTEGQVPTRNGKGMQMACRSPLFDVWTDAFDGVHPLVDIGAAYGANTFPALKGGADVVAIDCEEAHLDYIRRAWALECERRDGRLTTMYGALPALGISSAARTSGILCSEVIHFLRGSEIEESFRQFYEMLVPGGRLSLTCAEVSMLADCQPDTYERFQRQRAAGVRWAGEFSPEESARMSATTQDRIDLPNCAVPQFFHPLTADQIAEVATETGFRVVFCEAGMHPGYPEMPDGSRGTTNVQLVAVRS